jgi:hypothetical protein
VHSTWLGRTQSCSRLGQNGPSLADKMWTVSLPALDVPATIDSGDRLILDCGIKAAKFGLSHSEADQRTHTIFSIKPPLVPFKNPSQRLSVVDTLFNVRPVRASDISSPIVVKQFRAQNPHTANILSSPQLSSKD